MKKYISILILVSCSLIPLLFTSTIPFVAYRRLDVGSSLSSEHGRTGEQKLIVITLEAGSEYTIIMFSGPWDMDVSIRIGETPYMINGLSVDSGSTQGETMHFTAPHTGDFYIQVVGSSGSGFFDIGVETGITSPATGPNVEFFNGTYLIILILPPALILLVGLIILLLINRRKKSSLIKKPYTASPYRKVEKEEKGEKEIKFCQYCGNKIDSNVTTCPHCQTSLK